MICNKSFNFQGKKIIMTGNICMKQCCNFTENIVGQLLTHLLPLIVIQSCLSTASGLGAAQWHVMFPPVLNALSEGLLKAGIHRYFLASFPSEEIYLLWFPPLKWIDITVHQVSSDSSSAPLHRQWQLSPFLWLLAFSSISQKTFFYFLAAPGVIVTACFTFCSCTLSCSSGGAWGRTVFSVPIVISSVVIFDVVTVICSSLCQFLKWGLRVDVKFYRSPALSSLYLIVQVLQNSFFDFFLSPCYQVLLPGPQSWTEPGQVLVRKLLQVAHL